MKVLKWVAAIGSSLVLVAVGAVLLLSSQARDRLDRQWTIAPAALEIPQSPEAVHEGQRLASMYCAHCHGDDFGGKQFFEDQDLGYFDAPNLTKGRGGLERTDAQWVLAIRHGLRADGRGALVMPSRDFSTMTAEELGTLIAFLKTLPAIDRETRPRNLKVMAQVLFQVGAFGDALNVESIDHAAPLVSRPPQADQILEKGKHLVSVFGCQTCHGPQLTGGKDPNPKATAAPSLVQGSEASSWTDAQFIATLKTGVRPSGRPLNEFMPWRAFTFAKDDELAAMHAYLKTLPGPKTASR